MKFTIRSLFLVLFVIVFTSCDSINILGPNSVFVRIENVSEYKANDIMLNGVDFGSLESGEMSDYIDVEDLAISGDYIVSSYDADLETAEVSRRKCELCGVGLESEHLKKGNYTVELDLEGKSGKNDASVSMKLQ